MEPLLYAEEATGQRIGLLVNFGSHPHVEIERRII
jgi:hypothetical protein